MKFSRFKIVPRGFSLVEMMVVLGVVGLLLAFSAPSLFSLITANTLSGEGSILRNQLTYAQQIAVSKSADVEVRFFKFADDSAAQMEEEFRAFQLFQFDREGEMVPISGFFRVRPPVAFNEKHSTLLKSSASATQTDKQYGFVSPQEGRAEVPVGVGGEEVTVDYISFRFRPDGSTDLPFRSDSDDTWYITLVQGEGAKNENNPSNYVCLQVNPYNGQVSEFRP